LPASPDPAHSSPLGAIAEKGRSATPYPVALSLCYEKSERANRVFTKATI